MIPYSLFRDADYIFSALLDYERACLRSATNANEIAKAQATFLAAVVSKFTTEAFHTLRRYLQSINDTKSLLSLLLKAQRFTDAGITMGTRALQTEDFREKQGMLSVGQQYISIKLSNFISLLLMLFTFLSFSY